MKHVIILLLNWAMLLSVFAVFDVMKEKSFLIGLLVLIAVALVYKLRKLLQEAWNIPNTWIENIWEQNLRKEAIDKDKTKNDQDKDRLKKAIDREELPIDWVSTIFCDTIYVFFVIMILVRLYHKFFG